MSNQTQKKIKKNKKIEEKMLCAIETKLDILVDAVQALAAQSKVTKTIKKDDLFDMPMLHI